MFLNKQFCVHFIKGDRYTFFKFLFKVELGGQGFRFDVFFVNHLELLKSSYMNDGNNGTDDTSPTFKAFEEGSETMSKEANTQLAIRQEKFIRDLKNALLRIENKTYGICRVTGKLINKERLKLVPHATLSIEAKNMQK